MALNGSGVTDAIEQAAEAIQRENSVTKQDFANSSRDGGVFRVMLPMYGGFGVHRPYKVLPEHLPAYNRYAFFGQKDSILLSAQNYEAMWADALAIAVTKAASWSWEVDSNISLRRKRAQQVLLNSTAGIFTGWIHFMSAHLRGYLATGRAVVEIERETSAYSSSIRALHHLNPLRCQFTDDPQVPVLYYGSDGRVHELKYWQVMLFGDMVDPTLGDLGMVQSAAERAYRPITLLAAIEQYLYEKVTGKRALALHFVQGLTQQKLQDAVASADDERSGKGGMIYMGAAVLPIPIPGDTPIQVATIPLAELPDGFDPQLLRDDAYIKYANAIGLDVNDVDPRLAARQALGSGAQSIILNEKSKGRGLSAWRQAWTHNLNWWVLDTATTFAFSEDTLDDDLKQAQLAQTRTDTNSKRIADGIITAEQARNLAVDDGDLPREFLQNDATGGGTLADDEKQMETAEGAKIEAPAPATQPVPENGRTEPEAEAQKERNLDDVAAYLIDQEEENAARLVDGDVVAEARKAVQTAVKQLEEA